MIKQIETDARVCGINAARARVAGNEEEAMAWENAAIKLLDAASLIEAAGLLASKNSPILQSVLNGQISYKGC